MNADADADADAVAAAIRDLLARRAEGATICPSEAARAVAGDDFRALMPLARAVAARLAARGEIEVTQGGRPVDVRAARGPIRLRRAPPSGE